MDLKKNLLFKNFKSYNYPKSNISLTDESGYDSDGSLGSCRNLRKRQAICVEKLNSTKSSSITDCRTFRIRSGFSPYPSAICGSMSTKRERKLGMKSYSENELSFSSDVTRTSTPYSEWNKSAIKKKISDNFLCSVPKLILDTPPVTKSNSSLQSSGFFELDCVVDLDDYHFNSFSESLNVLQLIHRYAPYLLSSIFSYLPGKDLLTISHINSEFSTLITKSSDLNGRIAAYKKERKLHKDLLEKHKENILIKKGIADANFTHSNPRSPLKDIQKKCLPKKPPIPIVTLFDRFVKEGKKLGPGESQIKCIHCQCPARVFASENKAACSSEKCKYVFCTRCLLKEHKQQSECSVLMPRQKISTMKLISKACKKRLRRL